MSGRRQTPKKPTPERLRRRALHYLERFATSRSHLRFVLLRRAGREAEHHDIEPGQLAEWVDCLVADLERIGLLNDRLYGEQLLERFLARGHSLRLSGQKLRQKGIGSDLIDALLLNVEDTSDEDAAMALARRKRIGPWRRGEGNQDVKRKELAILARAGFAYAIARGIVETDAIESDG